MRESLSEMLLECARVTFDVRQAFDGDAAAAVCGAAG